jgi:hypothetical protein
MNGNDETNIEKVSLICQAIQISIAKMKEAMAYIEDCLHNKIECAENSLLLMDILKLVLNNCGEEISVSQSDAEKSLLIATREVTSKLLNKFVMIYKQNISEESKLMTTSQKCCVNLTAVEMFSSELEI